MAVGADHGWTLVLPHADQPLALMAYALGGTAFLLLAIALIGWPLGSWALRDRLKERRHGKADRREGPWEQR